MLIIKKHLDYRHKGYRKQVFQFRKHCTHEIADKLAKTLVQDGNVSEPFVSESFLNAKIYDDQYIKNNYKKM